MREEIRRRLNALGADIPSDSIGRQPSFPMSLLSAPEKLQSFLQVLEWMLTQWKEMR